MRRGDFGWKTGFGEKGLERMGGQGIQNLLVSVDKIDGETGAGNLMQ